MPQVKKEEKITIMDLFTFFKYACSIAAIGCLGFTYALMAKGTKANTKNQQDGQASNNHIR
ncbi:hypothetical protein [Halalkalibacterium ligniniphilum]|uniref:hypothetical protein n=1 Tax=Halalkalibacterium ligniniphilum TaxID=1134413 RepID=UPI000345DB51|nr:hypothetical protein [Halalkalibacterium ligniniphilum]